MRDEGIPIITSLLDTDKYKFSMQQVNLHQYPSAMAKYRFKLRNKGIDLTPIAAAVREQLTMVAELRFTQSDLDYLSRESHLSTDYIDFLSDFSLDTKHIHVNEISGGIDIYADGPMLKTSLWELYVLSIVNELWFRYTVAEPDYNEGRARLAKKIALVKNAGAIPGFNFTDFGTRRRFGKQWQAEVLGTLQKELPDNFMGTSNYYFARENNLTPIGTMAHEYLQAWQGLTHPLDAQKAAFNAWAQEFRGCLGDALTDIIGMDSFCEVLDLYFAKQFDGFRHDSGDPAVWCDKLIARLTELGIDTRTKRAIWSDGLNFKTMLDLYQQFHGRIQTGFGIGTNLTNDLGYTPLNIVMKMVELNGRPVAKLSDSAGKTMCENDDYVIWLAGCYGRKQEFVK
ncbi:MAG: nicotinate phosphoribosyltransferase [Alteromonadaceae bacterium]|nr:MAG: nicotinate phosphoribosyltransferase [Alteromonadaceae bacterium]